jgi:hypothetical protein
MRRYHGSQQRDLAREVSLEEALAQSSQRLENLLAASHSSPSQQAAQREQEMLVAAMLARLPEDYREVIILRNFEGLSHEEVARRMNRSIGAVRMLWVRALARLRQELQGGEKRWPWCPMPVASEDPAVFIDRTHLRWVVISCLVALLATVLSVAFPTPATASVWAGLPFGLSSTGLVGFCGLLPVRNKLLRIRHCARWRVLRSSVWEKGHIYLGLLSCLAVHFHAGFRAGGPLTSVLLILIWAITLSGLAGLLFRHLLVLVKAGKQGKGLLAARIIASGHFLTERLHVPLALSLLLLIMVHAVMALFY